MRSETQGCAFHTMAWRPVSGCPCEGHQPTAERCTESAPQHHQHRAGNQLFPKGGQRPEPVRYQMTPPLLVTVCKIIVVWPLVVLALGKLAANKAKCVYCHSSSSGLELDSSEGHHGLSWYPQPLRRSTCDGVCAEGEAGREQKRLAPNGSSLQSKKNQGTWGPRAHVR